MGLCNCTSIIIPTAKPCYDSNCIYTPHFLITAENSVAACIDGDTGVIVLTNKVQVGLCDKKSLAPHFEIVSKSSNIGTLSIDSTEILFTLVPSDLDTAHIKYRVKCGMFSSVGEVVIVVKDPCKYKICPDTHFCDPCLGEEGTCVEKTGDLSVGSNSHHVVGSGYGLSIG